MYWPIYAQSFIPMHVHPLPPSRMGDDGSYMYVYILPVDFYKNIFMTPAILPQKDLCTVNCNFSTRKKH